MNAKSYRVARLGLFIIFFVAISAVQCIIQRNTAFAKENIISVSSETEFTNAVTAATSANPVTIQLSDNIIYAADDGLTIPEGDITIDYNGHKISTANSKYLINTVPSGSSLTLVNAEMTDIHDSVIGDNYGSITFESTAGEGIKTTARRSCDWQEIPGTGVWDEVCVTEGNIISNNYEGSIHFIDGTYVSADCIIKESYGGNITFDNGYYDSIQGIVYIAENTTITVNNGEFITKEQEAFYYYGNSSMTFYDGKITAYYACFDADEKNFNDHTVTTIYNGTFKSTDDAAIYNYADSSGTATLNIYGGNFTSYGYKTIYNDAYDSGGTAITNIYGGAFKFENLAENDYDYPVIYNNAFGGSTATVNLLGEATFETNGQESSAFESINTAQIHTGTGYSATPKDFLANGAKKVQISPRSFNMAYLPGTEESITNLPAPDSSVIGHEYTVSSTIPEREGYEFIGWTLDYNVETKTSYTVRYLKEGTKEALTKEKIIYDQPIGTTITTTAININGYNLIGEASQSKTLTRNAEDNVITFYYSERPAVVDYGPNSGPTIVDYITDEPYIVHHILFSGPMREVATDFGEALAGEPLTVYASDDLLYDYGYQPMTATEQTKETVPCNHVLEYQEFRISDNGWYRIIPDGRLNWQVDGLQQNVVVSKKDDTYTIWTKDQLTEEEQVAIYESFRANVYGMSDAEYANCQFMYANVSTLNGITINDDYISFDDDTVSQSLAIGFYLPSYEKIYEKGGDTLEFTFLYRVGGGLR